MFIIEVIPIAKGIGVDTLSYFTSKEVHIGAIVNIPLRKKITQGIVVSIKLVEDLKSEIKNADFSLRKLDIVKSNSFFSKEFIDMVRQTSDYYATHMGSVLDSLVPDYILKNIGKLKFEKQGDSKESEHKIESEHKTGFEDGVNRVVHEKYAVQGDDEERYGTWKSLIRQEFAKKCSIFFLFPTTEEAEYAFSILEKGVEGYAFILHSSLQKKFIDSWNDIIKEPHPVVIIATAGFLSFSRKDIKTIVIERENSKSYKIPRRPFLDIRYVAELLSERMGIRLFLADNFLRLETLWRQSQGEIASASPFKFRSLSTARDILVDMRKEIHHKETQGYESSKLDFKIFSDEVERLIFRTKEKSEHMIILTTRRGLSPSTVCGDCQNIVTCNNCSAPIIFHKTRDDEKGFFLCHYCGERRSSEEYCKACGSWKLQTLGIGIDLVEEVIKNKFPGISLFRIDSDTIHDDKSAHAIIQKYKTKPGSILLGTEMVLQYIHDKAENSVIISLDSLFSLPDFRMSDKIFSMILRMRTIAVRDFIVQTRKANEKVFEYGMKGNLSDFYRHTIEERKKFNYPPFFVLIKITLEGKKDDIVKEMEEIQTCLEPYEVNVFPAFTHTVKGNFVLHGLIRIEKEKWPNTILVKKIRNLSPSATIKVDPESLL
ncbi:MAG TPA: hypothetical protein VJJ28_03285 [Candidatus Paceibacterota bacterium]